MVDRRQLEAMIAKGRAIGANISVTHDADGWIDAIQVCGIRGIGPHPMGPIAFSEAMHRAGLGVGPIRKDAPDPRHAG